MSATIQPYNYAGQDPVNDRDPDGRMIDFTNGETLADHQLIHPAEDNCATRECDQMRSNHCLCPLRGAKALARYMNDHRKETVSAIIGAATVACLFLTGPGAIACAVRLGAASMAFSLFTRAV